MQDNAYLLKVLRIVGRIISIIGALYIVAALIIFFIPGSYRVYAFDIQNIFSSWIPTILRGTLVYSLPFGGGIRGDYLVYGIILKLLGKFLRKAAR